MKHIRKPSGTLTTILATMDEETIRRTRDKMLVAVKIADALSSKNISQKSFAEMMGKSESVISDWISGDRNFTIDTLSDIGHCLGISLINSEYMRATRLSNGISSMKFAKTRTPSVYNTYDTHTLSPVLGGKWESCDNILFSVAF